MSSRRQFIKTVGSALPALVVTGVSGAKAETGSDRPNILFCMADDWGWPHAELYNDRVVNTPTFNRLAGEGVLFQYAYVSSPSCTPSRNAVLTGQYHWRLKDGASLRSTLDSTIPVYPLLLEKAGYHVGHWRKCWGPGELDAGGYVDTHPGGKEYPDGFRSFLSERPKGVPFCFWLGSSDPHRPYEKGSGREFGIDVGKVHVPEFYPDTEDIRSDIADYYYEVNRFDRDCGEAIRILEEIGELDNTIIVMTGDNGIPFPRCKGNLYDMGVHAPLAIRWGDRVRGGRTVNDFVSFTDFAPTFLEAAGVDIPRDMTGRSLCPQLFSSRSGRIDKTRDHIFFGRERHTPAQLAPSLDGYPSRGIRTDGFLYIRNFAPERWPAGVPKGSSHPMGTFSDCDDGPTKQFLIAHRDDPEYARYYNLSFAKRPAEELYDVYNDPDEIVNLAENPAYRAVRDQLSARLMKGLENSGDPRVVGGGEAFDKYPYRAPYDLKKKP